jgi:MSHA biogenesis protein MshI
MQIPILSRLFRKPAGNSGRVVTSFRGDDFLMVRLNSAADKAQVVSYAVRQLATRDAAELAKCCNSLQLSAYQYSTLLCANEYQLLSVDAPNVPAEELKSAVRWRVKDTLGYPADEAAIDVLQIPKGNQGVERAQSLYVVAAANSLIAKRIALFEDAKLALNVIDIPEMAQRNVAALLEDEGRGLALLAFDETGGLLTFTGHGELYLARRIEISIGQLRDADENLRQQAYDRLELEVQRSMDSFDRNFNHIAVSRLVVAASSETGLVEKFRGNMYVPVERLDFSNILDLSAVPELMNEEAQMDAFYVLGAALREEGQAA